jgi:hypothetical protein
MQRRRGRANRAVRHSKRSDRTQCYVDQSTLGLFLLQALELGTNHVIITVEPNLHWPEFGAIVASGPSCIVDTTHWGQRSISFIGLGMINQANTVNRTKMAIDTGYTAKLPYIRLLVLAGLSCFPDILALPGGASGAIIFATFAVIASLNAVKRRSNEVLDSSAGIAVLVILLCGSFLIIWSLLSIVDAAQPLRAGRVLVTHIMGAAFLLLFYAAFTPKRATTLVSVVTISLAATSLLIFASFFYPSLKLYFFKGTDRAFGFFRHSNQFGMVLAAFAPVALSMLMTAPTVGRLGIRLLVFIGICFGLIASGSKTNLLLFACTSLVVLAFAPFLQPELRFASRRVLRNFMAAGLIAIVGFGALNTVNPRALRILQQFLIGGGQVHSLESREVVWRSSYREFLKDPLLGQGAGQRVKVYNKLEGHSHSHNVIVDSMRTLGVPGLFAMFIILVTASAILLSTIVQAYRARQSTYSDRLMSVGVSVGALSYIASNMTSDSFGPSTSSFFWIATYVAFFMRRSLATGSIVLDRPATS